MKKIALFIILSILVLTTGCDDKNDDLNVVESSGPNVFQNVDDLENGMIQAYMLVSTAGLIEFTSIFTDEVSIGTSNTGQGLTNDALHTYNLDSSNSIVNDIWFNNYELINFVNVIINDAATIIPSNAAEQQMYNKVLAEAYSLRAFGHAQLLSVFAVDLTDPMSLGVIAVDFIPSLNQALPRNTVGETMTLINQDLAQSETLFSGLTTSSSNVQRTSVDINFVRALRARISLYTEDYTTAESMADLLLSSFNISSHSDFPSVWDNEDTSGIIFKVPHSNENVLIGAIWTTNSTDISGAPIYEVSRPVYNILDSNINDIRLNVYLDQSSIVDLNYTTRQNPRNSDVLVIDKYPGNGPALVGGLRNDEKILRAAELHLIKAEARVFNSDLIGAAREIQTIRHQRHFDTIPLPTVVYSSTQEAWSDILLERRLELYLEGHRYIDFNRLASKANLLAYDRDAVDCRIASLQVCDLSSNDIRTQYLPIPQAEITNNPGVNGQQNPGY